MTALILALGTAMAFPGVRSDGVVPAVGVAEGGLVLGGAQQLGGELAPAAALTGEMGVAEDITLGLTLGWRGAQLMGAELRGEMPLLGRRDDPVLTLLAGVESAAVLSELDGMPPWWAKAGLITGGALGGNVRLYGGAVANWVIAEGVDGLWIEPSIGASWRPAVGDRLGMVLSLEAAGSTDLRFEEIAVGPVLMVGIGGR